MRITKPHNSLCRARALLPCCVVVAVVLWCLPQGVGWWPRCGGFAVCALTAYLLAEMCNGNMLFRVYTRAAASIFILTLACTGWYCSFGPSALAGLFVCASLCLTLASDGRPASRVTDVFHTFVLLGLACLCEPWLVVLAPLCLLQLLIVVHGLSARAFFAGVTGFALPLFSALGVCRLAGRGDVSERWMARLAEPAPVGADAYLSLSLPMAGLWLALVLLALWGGLYYARSQGRDKLRVRQCHLILYMQTAVLIALAALQPRLCGSLLPAVMVSLSPSLAHYFALGETWLSAVAFALAILVLCALAVLAFAWHGEGLPADVGGLVRLAV